MNNRQNIAYSALFTAMMATMTSSAIAADESGLQIGGLVEVEAGYAEDYAGEGSSDIAVATVEIGLEHEISEEVSARVVLLHEEDDTPLEVDVAVINLAPTGYPFAFTFGQDYLPFGTYETALVNDPLTLEIGETRETAVVAILNQGPLAISAYAFNGDQDQDGDDSVSNFGVRVGAVAELGSLSVDYISNIADADGLQENDYGYAGGADAVAGLSVAGLIATDMFHVSGEYLTALDPLLADGNNSEPSAAHVEIGFNTDALNYGLAFQATDEAQFLELPKSRISAGVSKDFEQGYSLAVELTHDQDYDLDEGGTDETAQGIVFQLASEF